jgi:hypothetical protein
MGSDGQIATNKPSQDSASFQLIGQFLGAEDGIRTRDPHLGKVFEFVHGVLASPLSWSPVHGLSMDCA